MSTLPKVRLTVFSQLFYATVVSATLSNKIEGQEKGIDPVQVILCLKQKGQKKIKPHHEYWFFDVFGPIFQPNVCVLLDVGTMPVLSSSHLWKTVDIHSNVGGAWGGIVTPKDKCRESERSF